MIAGLEGLFRDSGLHFADDAEAPLAVTRDVDAALWVTRTRTAEGRRAATRAGSFNLNGCSACGKRLWSGYVMPLALVRSIQEAAEISVEMRCFRVWWRVTLHWHTGTCDANATECTSCGSAEAASCSQQLQPNTPIHTKEATERVTRK
jgi:hypothetical protein